MYNSIFHFKAKTTHTRASAVAVCRTGSVQLICLPKKIDNVAEIKITSWKCGGLQGNEWDQINAV